MGFQPFPLAEAQDQQSQLWTFDSDAAGTRPSEFVIGTLYDGRPAGEWKVLQKADAPSPPHIFGQVQAKGAEHAYKVVLVESSRASNLELEVSLLAVDGKADMGGGLIWRAATILHAPTHWKRTSGSIESSKECANCLITSTTSLMCVNGTNCV